MLGNRAFNTSALLLCLLCHYDSAWWFPRYAEGVPMWKCSREFIWQVGKQQLWHVGEDFWLKAKSPKSRWCLNSPVIHFIVDTAVLGENTAQVFEWMNYCKVNLNTGSVCCVWVWVPLAGHLCFCCVNTSPILLYTAARWTEGPVECEPQEHSYQHSIDLGPALWTLTPLLSSRSL